MIDMNNKNGARIKMCWAFRIRYKNQVAVDMEAPACCEHFIRNEQDWKKGRVERTKRSLRELFSENKQYLRGAVVLLAYDSDEVNNRVRVAAKQVGAPEGLAAHYVCLSSYITPKEFVLRNENRGYLWYPADPLVRMCRCHFS